MKTDLIVLGLVNKGITSGYDIMKQVKKQSAKNADIKFGSIYHALDKSLKNGWIKRTGSTQEGSNPEKHNYKITPKGEIYLKRLVRKYLYDSTILFNPDLTLTVIEDLDAEEIEDKIDIVKKKLSSIKNNDSLYLKYIEIHLRAELDWLKSI